MSGWDSRVRHPQAPCICPAAPALPTPNAHFPLSGLCSLSCTRPGLHHSWLCLQSSRWRSEARCPPPRFPLNSFYSLLGTPPPSSPLRPTAPAPGELSSLPGGSQLPFHSSGSPGRPGGYTGKEKEAGWGWGWGRDQHRAGNCPSFLFPHPAKGRCHPQKEHLAVARVWPPRLGTRPEIFTC